MLKDIWNIWFLNEDISNRDINDVLLHMWTIKSTLKSQPFNQQKSASLGPKSFIFFRHTVQNTSNSIEKLPKISAFSPCTDFNFCYISFDTSTAGVREVVRGLWWSRDLNLSHKCFKLWPQSLDYLPSCIDLYITMNQEETFPVDKYQCRKSTVQWDYNPCNLILTTRR